MKGNNPIRPLLAGVLVTVSALATQSLVVPE